MSASSGRGSRRFAALVAVVAILAVLATAVPAFGATSTVTQQDCNAGRITRNGQVLSRAQCEKLIGQRVNLATTGFDAWILIVGGVACLGVAFALRTRRHRLTAQAAG